MKVSAQRPDGSTVPLIWIRDWDFNWQGGYQFAEPVALPKGSRIEFEYTYDNSAGNPRNPANPPVRVKWGEQTKDEMALAFLIAALPSPADVAPFEKEMEGEFLAMLFAEGTRLEQLPDELTPEERKGRTFAFRMFDRDHDGTLSADESAALIRFLRNRQQ